MFTLVTGTSATARLAPAITYTDCPAACTWWTKPTDLLGLEKSMHWAWCSSALFRSGTHRALQAVKKGKMGELSFQPLGSLQLESQDPDLLSYLLSPHSVPVGTQEIKQVTHMAEGSSCSATPKHNGCFLAHCQMDQSLGYYSDKCRIRRVSHQKTPQFDCSAQQETLLEVINISSDLVDISVFSTSFRTRPATYLSQTESAAIFHIRYKLLSEAKLLCWDWSHHAEPVLEFASVCRGTAIRQAK